MIIGISGKAQSGKTTVGDIIQRLTMRSSIWQIKMFAYKIKQCVSLITGVPVEDLEKIEVKNSLIGKEWGGLTYRKMMQLLGTEVGRNIHYAFWINALFADYTEDSNWIITDVRFPNEVYSIDAKDGIIIRVNRNVPQEDDVASHRSETELDNTKLFDYEIDNNGTIDELIEKVKYILVIEGILK